jgi:hypothetical protein
MKSEIKDQWIKALLSGEYKQTINVLRRIHPNGSESYCCLGVLCDLHAKTNNCEWRDDIYLSRDGLPPVDVVVWAGIYDEKAALEYDCDESGVEIYADKDSLATLNDRGATFEEIADIIEKRL